MDKSCTSRFRHPVMMEGIDPAGVLSDISKETSCVRLATERGNGPVKLLALSFKNFKFLSFRSSRSSSPSYQRRKQGKRKRFGLADRMGKAVRFSSQFALQKCSKRNNNVDNQISQLPDGILAN